MSNFELVNEPNYYACAKTLTLNPNYYVSSYVTCCSRLVFMATGSLKHDFVTCRYLYNIYIDAPH